MSPLDGAITYPAQLIDDFAWETDLPVTQDLRGNINASGSRKSRSGVVGAIVPWNYPFEVTLTKLAQALATGNTVVLKPAPDTPWNATLLGRIVAEQTDIPAGVLNIVTSSDHLVGEELTLSPLVDLISFTGSTAVGKRIMEKGAATIKRLFLELGGKSATIVLDDADFATAMLWAWPSARTPARAAPSPPGCCCPGPATTKASNCSRSSVRCALRRPAASGRDHGPGHFREATQRILGYIEKGVAEGATLALGGEPPTSTWTRAGSSSRPCSPTWTTP